MKYFIVFQEKKTQRVCLFKNDPFSIFPKTLYFIHEYACLRPVRSAIAEKSAKKTNNRGRTAPRSLLSRILLILQICLKLCTQICMVQARYTGYSFNCVFWKISRYMAFLGFPQELVCTPDFTLGPPDGRSNSAAAKQTELRKIIF